MKHLAFMSAAAVVILTQPVYVGNGGIVGNTALTTVTLTFPGSGVADKDIAFLSLHSDNHTTMAVPGGWTPCGAQEDTSGTVSARLWWKRCDGTENGTTVACTRGSGTTGEWFGGVISIFRNCPISGDPFEGYSAVQSNTTTASAPAVTSTGDKRLACLFYCIGDDTVSTPGGSYTEQWEQFEQSGNDGLQALDTQVMPTATTIAATSRTILSNPAVCFGLALLPGPAGTGPTYGPITRTHLGQASITGTSVGVSVTATAGALLLVTAGVRRNSSAVSAITCSDNAGVGNVYSDTVTQGAGLATNGVRQAVFKCRLVAGGTFTITIASASATSMGLSVEQYVDASNDLSNVSPMVYNAAGDPACTLPNAPASTNIVQGQISCLGSSANTLPSGHTSIVLVSPAGMRVEPSFVNNTNTTGSWSSANSESVGCLIEVKQAV